MSTGRKSAVMMEEEKLKSEDKPKLEDKDTPKQTELKQDSLLSQKMTRATLKK